MSVGMGTNSALDPIAALAAKHGLTQTSGARPGSITSSGNLSLHSSGAAADWSGTPTAMRAFFDDVRRLWGSAMDELIYSPAGSKQIKNGADHTYTGQVVEDHYDHVHTGYTGKYGALTLSASAQVGSSGFGVGSALGAVLDRTPQGLGLNAAEKLADGGNPLSAVTDVPRQVVQSITSELAASGGRLLLEIALILGGAVLALWGVVRISGAQPSDIAAAVPAGRAAKASGAMK